jgi:hypothetical protein
MLKPIFYLEPCFGLANRLLMTVSAYRYSLKLGHELRVVWRSQVAGLASAPHFYGPLDDYFKVPFKVQTDDPDGHFVFLPKSISQDRTVYDPASMTGVNVYVMGWKHLILFPMDLYEGAHFDLTSELQQAGSQVLAPTRMLEEHICRTIPNLAQAYSRNFDMGIHLRGGGHIAQDDSDFYSNLALYETMTRHLDCLLPRNNASFRVFVCGDPNYCLRLRAFLLGLGVDVITPEDLRSNPLDYFSDKPSRGSDLNAFRDFYMLTKCRNILTNLNSTFGSFAALLAGADRYITVKESIIKLPHYALSGSGL